MQTRIVALICSLMLMPSGIRLLAQDQDYPSDQQAPQPQQSFSPEQLDSLVAPIALYPDSLLSQVLVAATYPLEIVEANQWLLQNGRLQGQDLVEAAQQQNWDPSIQALVPFQDVIKRMASDVRWTTDLGNAFLANQSDVMNAVQRMRARARDNGKLVDTPQERVVTETQNGQTAIEIQPADPQVVYVPYYNPDYFWGPPIYPWPALYYPGVGLGWGWGYGIHVGLFFGGCCGWGGWGWGPGWFNHSVYVNNYFLHRYNFHEFGGGMGFRGNVLWAHDPGHRLGVPYANRGVAQRFGGQNFRGGGQRFAGGGGYNAGRYNGGGYNGGGQRFNGANSFRGSNQARPPQQSFAGRDQGRNFASPSQGRSFQQQQPNGGRSFQQQQPGGRSFQQQQFNGGRSFQPGNNNHSAFGGVQNGGRARVQSDHGFSSMGPQRTAPAFHGGGGGGGGSFHGGGGGGGGGGHASGGGGGHGGGRR